MNQDINKTKELEITTYKNIKKLEDFILNGSDLEDRINNHPRILSHLSENSDGSTWYGVDVLIAFEKTIEIRHWLSRSLSRCLVITNHAKGLAWLFIVLGNIYVEKIDSVSKYFFYSDLAESANSYLRQATQEASLRHLLLAVVRSSKRYLWKTD